IQTQEALKLLHGIQAMAGRGLVFAGEAADCYAVEYQRKPDCMSHDPLDDVIALEAGADSITLGDLLDQARRQAGSDATLELAREVLWKFVCPSCGDEAEVFCSLGCATADQARCPKCDSVTRDVRTFHRITGDESFLNRTPAQIGLPPFDILTARSAARSIGLELTADAPKVLGTVWSDESELEWA